MTMTQKPNLEPISRKKLRAYGLANRDNREALRIYRERLHHEPGVIRPMGSFNEEDFTQLEQLLERQSKEG